MEGYIKLYRQITKWEWYEDANTFRLFIHLLIKANHADANWRGNLIKRGQRFTSIGVLSHELSLSEKAIRIAIDKLIRTNEIVCKGASNGTMITICKYDSYQSNETEEGRAKRQTNGEQKGKRGASEGQQTIRTNNDNNDLKNEYTFTWRENFEKYIEDLNVGVNLLLQDSEWISEREKFHPNLDIKLSIEKGYKDYWGTEAGWQKKKKSKTENINWKTTFNNAIDFNKVYKQRQ